MEGYQTRQKQLVTSLLADHAARHFTAEQLCDALKEQGTPVGKATVYRCLEALVKSGVARRYNMENGRSACYQYVDSTADCHSHFHLKCSLCGKLEHVECEFLDGVAAHVRQHHGFVVDNSQTVLYGLCSRCAGIEGEGACREHEHAE